MEHSRWEPGETSRASRWAVSAGERLQSRLMSLWKCLLFFRDTGCCREQFSAWAADMPPSCRRRVDMCWCSRPRPRRGLGRSAERWSPTSPSWGSLSSTVWETHCWEVDQNYSSTHSFIRSLCAPGGRGAARRDKRNFFR